MSVYRHDRFSRCAEKCMDYSKCCKPGKVSKYGESKDISKCGGSRLCESKNYYKDNRSSSSESEDHHKSDRCSSSNNDGPHQDKKCSLNNLVHDQKLIEKHKALEEAKLSLEMDKIALEREKIKHEKFILETTIKTQEEIKKEVYQENIDKYKSLEAEKIKSNELKIRNDNLIIELNKGCIENTKNSDKCCICMDGPRDTVLVPCGHKFCCYSCIDDHCGRNKRVAITIYTKVYE